MTRDLLERAAWTFVQTFMATLATMPFTDMDGFVVVLVAALAAGLSAAKTNVIERGAARD